MCTSWVSGGAREYSLTNHTGPLVLSSPIRLARRPNYSQSKPIKSNYDQLWVIRMPRRLIAHRDGAAGCHFHETVTAIVFLYLHFAWAFHSVSVRGEGVEVSNECPSTSKRCHNQETNLRMNRTASHSDTFAHLGL